MKKIFNFLRSITVKDIIYVIVICLLLGLLSTSISRCQSIQDQYKNNMKALNDTIRYYKDANGDLVATKLAFESDIETLKLLNEEFYDQLQELKAKGKITSGTYFSGIIENPEVDTAYVILHDTISRGFERDFAFNNEYRTLEGNVKYKDDTVGVHITKDQIQFDYTVAIDNKNNIMIRSTNPYVKYNEITGFQIPKEKKKHWYAGPSIHYGYDPINKNGAFSIGVSVGYGLFKW